MPRKLSLFTWKHDNLSFGTKYYLVYSVNEALREFRTDDQFLHSSKTFKIERIGYETQPVSFVRWP